MKVPGAIAAGLNQLSFRASAFGCAMRFAMLSLIFVISAASPLQVDEYKAKAEFLVNFTKFTDWPRTAFDGPQDPFVIAVIGSDPFGAKLDTAFSGVSVAGRAVVIKRVKWGVNLSAIHLLFVPTSEAGRVQEIASQTRNRPILVIGESAKFEQSCGIINLFLRPDKRIWFDINNTAAKAGGLFISSKVLELARTVR